MNSITKRMLTAAFGIAAAINLQADNSDHSPPAPTATLLTTFNAIAFGCTVGPGGMLYVTDPTHGQILRVDPSTGI